MTMRDASRTAISDLSSRGVDIPVSATRDLANRIMGSDGILPLWFGEPDVETPKFICDAAARSMAKGNTFYVEGLGKPWFRKTLADYMSGLYGQQISSDRIAVTTSGTNALNLAFQMVLEKGERVVTTLPSFPTLLTVPSLQYAELDTVKLQPTGNGWQLDLDQLLEKVTGGNGLQPAKVLLINSPNNPTGWVMSQADIERVVETCRKSGTWIISDEVYARIVFDGKAAPGFASVADDEDRIIIVNSFSKSWAMTGWRLGWLTLPVSLGPLCEKLMEFSMSCAPEFSQAAGDVAVRQGEAFIAEQISKYRRGRDISIDRLSKMEGVFCVPPEAAFYALFKIDGVAGNIKFAEKLAREGGVGLAPGVTFDPDAGDWFRLCFAKSEDLLTEAFDRLEAFLQKR